MSDSALDSILDQYSEDAKKTQKITHLNLKDKNENLIQRIHSYQHKMN